MIGEKAESAALLYCREVLAKTAHYLDSARTDEGWVVRVAVGEERQRKGAAGPKRWNMLYEVHLDPDCRPLYHVRHGLWEKDVPKAASPTPQPFAGPSGAGTEGTTPAQETPSVEAGERAPVPGMDLVSAEPESTAPVETRPAGIALPASEEPEPDPPAGIDFAGSATAAPTWEEETGPAAMATDQSDDRETEAAPEPALPPEGELDDDKSDEGDLGGVEAETILEPDAASEAPAGDAPDRGATVSRTETEVAPPAVQERQGPPKVSFRFAADDAVGKPR